MSRRLSLSAKLSLGFIVILLIFSTLSLFTHARLQFLQQKDEERRALSARQQTALELKTLVQEMDATATGYLLSGKPELSEAFKASVPELERLTEAVGASAETRDQRNWRARLIAISKEFVSNFENAEKRVGALAPEDPYRISLGLAAYNASQLHKQTIFSLVDSFYNEYSSADLTAQETFAETIRETGQAMVWFTAAGIAVAVATAALSVLSLRSGIRRIRVGIDRVKDGDLSRPIAAARKDELGKLSDSFDASVASVRRMLLRTKTIAESLTAHSDRFRSFAASTKETNESIVRAMSEIAAGASTQAERAEIGAATIRELESRMDAIQAATNMLLAQSDDTKRSMRTGTENVAELKTSAERTGAAMRTMADALRRLERRSAEISDIIATIRDISQQTNVLALNAAIEAARAGVHGRGFSVIAEEVRRLSTEAGSSSERIEDMLSQLRSGVVDAASSLQQTAASFTEQERKVASTGDAFRTIERLIDVLDKEINGIGERLSEAKEKQAELAESILVVASVAQQTAAGVEETAAATADQDESVGRIAEEANDIHALAEALFAEIDKFTIESDDQGITDASAEERTTEATTVTTAESQEAAEDASASLTEAEAATAEAATADAGGYEGKDAYAPGTGVASAAEATQAADDAAFGKHPVEKRHADARDVADGQAVDQHILDARAAVTRATAAAANASKRRQTSRASESAPASAGEVAPNAPGAGAAADAAAAAKSDAVAEHVSAAPADEKVMKSDTGAISKSGSEQQMRESATNRSDASEAEAEAEKKEPVAAK